MNQKYVDSQRKQRMHGMINGEGGKVIVINSEELSRPTE